MNLTKEKKMNKKNKLNIVDLIALATHKPELFTDKEQLKFILNVKETMVKEFAKEMMAQ